MEIQTQPQTPGDCFWLCPCTKWSQVPLNYWNSRLRQHTAIFNVAKPSIIGLTLEPRLDLGLRVYAYCGDNRSK